MEKGKHKKDKTSAWYVPDWDRTHKMFWTGALIRGPQALLWYWWINPWYLKHIGFKLFPKFFATRNVWRISIFSVFIDSAVG